MARRHKSPASARLSFADLTSRLRKAEKEGRFQQALELARSLYKQDPSPPHKELLQHMVLSRARQQRAQGQERDSLATLEAAVALDAGPDWQGRLAVELAAAGDARRALHLLEPFPDAPVRPRVLALAADAALGKGKAGRALLPEALQGPFDLVVQAFTQAEAGQAEAARTTLQGIGLQSPFLEWKLLLRGLIAYYQKDDARALENWQRLTADRLPARLAAPLRFLLDPAFRLAQPPPAQAALRRQADRLTDSGLVPPLRALQAALADERHLPQAFRLAEQLLPALRQQAPDLVPRLASCFYWAVIHSGRPEDVPRFRRVFGAPPEDPQFARLDALALEHRGQLPEAHKAWQQFEQEVANHPAAWPPGQADQVRALVWYHMGQNAAKLPDKAEMEQLPAFLRNHPDRPRPLKPPAEECFERSLALAPDLLETHQALFNHWLRKKKPAEAVKAGRRLLERFPEHAPTLEALGDLLLTQKKPGEGLELLQAALRHNPLERRLRSKVSTAHLLNSRTHAEAGRFDDARREYQAALALGEGRKDPRVLCKWAACEFKAGDADRAEALLAEVLAGEGNRLAVAYNMLIEAIRLKLPRPLKTRFDAAFQEALAEPATGAGAAAVAQTAATHQQAGVRYVGQKTHEKKVLAYLEKALRADFTEAELAAVCEALGSLDARRLEAKFLRLGQTKFPDTPDFPLWEAERNIALGPHRCPVWQTEQLLQKAQGLAAALPRGERQKELQERITDLQQTLAAFNPFSHLSSLMEDYFDLDDLDDEDEDDLDDDRF